MKKFFNQVNLVGYLYDHDLKLREAGPNSKNPGTQFIMGTIDISTEDDMTNIVQVHFSYTTATTAKGTPNATFTTLMNIIDGNYKTVMAAGKENAVKLRVDSAVGLNDFYTDRSGKEELVSAKRNEGGFVHVYSGALPEKILDRNKFKCDMLITNVREVEADEERGLPSKVILKGAIFDFRNALLPVEFSVLDEGGKGYFLGLEATNKNPAFTCVWGNEISEVVKRQYVTASAFGADEVREVSSTRKDYVVTGSSQIPYVWDDEETLTAKDVVDMMAARETYLATIKQRQDEYKASKNAAPAKSNGGFNF